MLFIDINKDERFATFSQCKVYTHLSNHEQSSAVSRDIGPIEVQKLFLDVCLSQREAKTARRTDSKLSMSVAADPRTSLLCSY